MESNAKEEDEPRSSLFEPGNVFKPESSGHAGGSGAAAGAAGSEEVLRDDDVLPESVSANDVRDGVARLMGSGARPVPVPGRRMPLSPPAGHPDPRGWTEAVIADVWDRMVALLRGPGGLATGIVALREVESFLGSVVAGLNARLKDIQDDYDTAADPWADPRDVPAETGGESRVILKTQRAHQASLESAREQVEDRLDYVEFQIGVVRSLLWNVIGYGSTADWAELEPEIQEEVVSESTTASVSRRTGDRNGPIYAAVFLWVMEHGSDRYGGRHKIDGQASWLRAVDDALLKGVIGGIASSASGMWKTLGRAATRRLGEGAWPERLEPGGDREEQFRRQTEVLVELASLYDGPKREGDEAPDYNAWAADQPVRTR